MSDSSQGDGWWIASDGKWYPPQTPPTPPVAAPQAPEVPLPPAEPQPPAQQPSPVPGDAQWQQPPPAPGVLAPNPGAAGPPVGPPSGRDGEDEAKDGKGKWIALAVVLLLIAGATAFFLLGGDDDDDSDVAVDVTQDDSAPKTDIGDATKNRPKDGKIEFDKEYTDSLEGDRTEARYTLDAPAGAIMTFEITNEATSTRGVFTTLESKGDRFLNFRTAPGVKESQEVILAAEGKAPFELIFTEGPAEFTFKVGIKIQDDAREGGDAGAELDSAFAVEAGRSTAGMLGGKDRTDHFTMEIEPGSEMVLKVATSADSERGAYFTVKFAGKKLFGERVATGIAVDLPILLADDDSGTLEVIVTEGPADYTFTVDFVEQKDGGEPGDAPGTLAKARKVEVTAPIEGAVGDRDTSDFYTFDAPSGAFNVAATSDVTNEASFYVTVQNASGDPVAGFRVKPGATETKPVEVEPGSQVRLQITEGRAKYSVKVG